MEVETKLAAMNTHEGHDGEQVGTPSVFSCPECGGVLWELHDGNLLRFRCRVGHAYSVDSILAGQTEAVEQALWTALKALEENASFSRRLANDARKSGKEWLARRFEDKEQEAEKHAAVIRQVLANNSMDTQLNTNADLVAEEEQGKAAPSPEDTRKEG
jgi:two-component system chemotaxis response regulator CheB